VAGFAGPIRLAIKMIKVNPAGLAGMMDVIVAVSCRKTIGFQLLALARYATAAA
jgi:hypothetical protein